MSKADEIPEHPELISVRQARKILGMDRNSVYFKIYEQKAFATVYRVGDEDERPFLLLSRAEVQRVASEDRQSVQKKQLMEWHRRIRRWATEEFYPHDPGTTGRLPVALIEHYLQAHPQDPRPV